MCRIVRTSVHPRQGITAVLPSSAMPQTVAPAQKQEPGFILRMVRIGKLNSILAKESRLRLLKRHAVLTLVCPVLSLIPFKARHDYITIPRAPSCKQFLEVSAA
jgi:hypothetical protein